MLSSPNYISGNIAVDNRQQCNPKVLWWIDHMGAGGSQASLVKIIELLSNKISNQAVIVLNSSVLDVYRKRLEECGVEILIVGKWKLLSGIAIFSLWWWLRKRKFDVSITFLFFSDVIGVLFSYLCGIKGRISSQRSSNDHYNCCQKAVLRCTLRYVDRVVFNSYRCRDIRQNYIPHYIDTQVIPNGITVTNPAESRKVTEFLSELGIDSCAKLVGHVGRLSKEKGQEVLIRALCQLEQSGVELILVGDGPQAKYLARLATEIGVYNQVHMLGHREDVPTILSALDIYVQPSQFEGMPVAVLEAIGVGCPVIASDVGGIGDLIPSMEHGWLVPANDVESLAEAIGQALKSPKEAVRRSLNAREYITENFSIDKTVENWSRTIMTSLATNVVPNNSKRVDV